MSTTHSGTSEAETNAWDHRGMKQAGIHRGHRCRMQSEMHWGPRAGCILECTGVTGAGHSLERAGCMLECTWVTGAGYSLEGTEVTEAACKLKSTGSQEQRIH